MNPEKRHKREYEVLSFPSEREIVIDAGRLASRRHIIHALIEIDVTLARELLRAYAERRQCKLSFTAFVVACLAKTIDSDPLVQAYRDWRGRLIVFHDVDIVTMIEPSPGAVAVPHIIRAANRKTVRESSDEIRSIQTNPDRSTQRRGLMWGPKAPRFARRFFYWMLRKNPHWFKQMAGTAVVTSVGMFGRGGGWGIGFLPLHTLGVTVGGIAEKPGIHHGKTAKREYLNLTISFDHDIVDGARAARFAKTLSELIESASVLKEESSGTGSREPTNHSRYPAFS